MNYPNVSSYDEKGFAPPLEAGHYLIKLSEVRDTDKDSQFYIDKNGIRFCMFMFKVAGKPNTLIERFFFDEPDYEYYNQNMGKFKQLLMACGVDPDKEGDTKDLIGKVFLADVSSRLVKDKTYNNIKEYKEYKETDKSWPDTDDDDLPF